jgi:ABC-type dipeptide/oligopeptide/nickel transport system ATPase subunit
MPIGEALYSGLRRSRLHVRQHVSVQAEILNLLTRLRRDHGLTILMVSHDLAVVAHICDRMTAMQTSMAAVTRGRGQAAVLAPFVNRTRANVRRLRRKT